MAKALSKSQVAAAVAEGDGAAQRSTSDMAVNCFETEGTLKNGIDRDGDVVLEIGNTIALF